MRSEIIFSLVIVILSVNLVSGLYTVANSSFLEKTYYDGDLIRGKLNISFFNQNSKSVFTSSLGGETTLQKVLNKSSFIVGRNFECNPMDCETDYTSGVSQGAQSEEFNLDSKAIRGFKIIGKNVEIEDLNFELSSDTQTSCKNAIYVDFLNDGVIDFFNTKYEETTCGEKNFGCFRGTSTTHYTNIGMQNSRWLCEKITLQPAPAYKIGAKVEKESGNQAQIAVGLYDLEGNSACGGGRNGGSGSPADGEISTIARCPFREEFEGLICITQTSGDAIYKVRVEEDTTTCGAIVEGGNDLNDVDADYEIFAQPLSYASIGTVDFKGEFYNLTGKNLGEETDNYIEEKYNRNCENGCYIPISFWRADTTDLGLQQKITMATTSTKNLRYATTTTSANERNFYILSEKDYTITTKNYTLFDLQNFEFEIPALNGNRSVSIKLDNSEILKQDVSITTGFDYGISPRVAIIGRNTNFFIVGNMSVNSSKWTFGDGGSAVNPSGKSANHAYDSPGEYEITVEATNPSGAKSVKRFKVRVDNPMNSAKYLLREYDEKIDGVEEDLSDFAPWTKSNIEKQVKIEEIKSQYTLLNNQFQVASTDSQYMDIIEKLIALKVPENIFVSKSGTVPADVGYNSANMNFILEISDADEESEAVKNSVIRWIQDNYEVDIQHQTISARTDGVEGNLVKEYKINLKKKIDAEELFSYLIIGQPEEKISFKTSYDQRSVEGGATYVPISYSGTPSLIEFAIFGESAPEPQQLGVYISPALSELEINDKPYGGITFPELNFRWMRFAISLLVLLTGFLVVYLLIQGWYRKNYESHLFKNQDDLYNIINFIYNSRREGKEDREIRRGLKDKSWKGEQINYAFNKIDGKRTGLWEIPLFKFVENKKVKKEIEKRQRAPIDARFIKKPGVY